MKFDIIITTYNRPDFIISLVEQINKCSNPLPTQIIVVDASESINKKVQLIERVTYLHSSHKNQPYQRFLGFSVSKEEFVVFFDDDVKILNSKLFYHISEKFMDKGIAGVTLNFTDDGSNAITKAMKVKTKSSKKNKIFSFLWSLTGTPTIKANKIWFAGLRGKTDFSQNYAFSMSGPGTLSFRRAFVSNLFDSTLFSMYERKLGKGEDKYISMAAINYGKIALVEDVCLLHPSHDSSYFKDIQSFTKREIFSRLWLSKRYAQINDIHIFWVYLHYYWYALWRIMIAGLHSIFKPNRNNFNRLIGRLKGVYATFFIRMNSSSLCPDIIWENEIENDIKQITIND